VPFLNIDIVELVKIFGYTGLFIVIFVESGIFFGFLLPAGSMLFIAGLLASQGIFNIYWLALIMSIAAVLGDSAGYLFGAEVGKKIFSYENSIFFNKKYLENTRKFYAKHGSFAIVLGRFIPIIRTFVPILAGVTDMHYGRFMKYNIVSAICWATGMILLGYFIGASVPGIEGFLLPMIFVVIFLSVVPILLELTKTKTYHHE